MARGNAGPGRNGGWREFLTPLRRVPILGRLLGLGARRAPIPGSLPQARRVDVVLNNANVVQNPEVRQQEIQRVVNDTKTGLEEYRQQQQETVQQNNLQQAIAASRITPQPPFGPTNSSNMSLDRGALAAGQNHPELSLPVFYWNMESFWLPRVDPAAQDPPLMAATGNVDEADDIELGEDWETPKKNKKV